MQIPYKPTKPAGGDPRRPRRLRRCVNQDRRGAITTLPTEAAMQPSMEACAWIHQAQDHLWRPYVMRTSDAAMGTSPSHVYYPWQVFFDGDFNRRRGLYIKAVLPKMPGASSFSKTCRYRVPSTLARRQQFSWRRNKPEPLPRGLRTAVATTTSRPPSIQTEVSRSAPEGALQIHQGPQQKELPVPRLPSPEG
jgi:hypothetical protein